MNFRDLFNTSGTSTPEIHISEWLNAPQDFGLAQLRGRVVLLHKFQMLCPGCVTHGIPQAQRMESLFDECDVSVVGLHTVFEHHDVMAVDALRAFVHEYRITHPIGVDQASPDSHVPQTMLRLQLRGTPSLLLLDRTGNLRASHFGRLPDTHVGAMLGALAAEKPRQESMSHLDREPEQITDQNSSKANCNEDSCRLEE